ncbi:sensor histidine kinase [Pseudoclavibacter sp. VKM Ac-2888]|uniref:sensor histidine kinase n=1 Tax=Pseudoclavibacter sp. VKM Ac-2888 TaxID=2783830 RepID=UPI00188A6C17|nr:histidine kinase [Pseudoclavibacter sp. VKM Ac-2888]MBF4548686.1 ATPase [Pseudoclavibacter sp. VKM Ac-2888]
MTRSIDARAARIPLRATRGDALRPALLLIAVLALALGGVQLAVGVDAPVPFWVPLAFTAVFFVWTAAGVIAWWQRPLSMVGGLLLVGAIAMFLGGVGNLGLPVLVELSTIFATLILAVTVHLLHAFPSGRLQGRVSIATVAVGYGVTLLLQIPLYVLPPDTLPHLVGVWVQAFVGLGVMGVTAALLIRRLRSADPKNLRVLLPLYLYGILAVLSIPLSANVLRLLGAPGEVIGSIQLVVIAGIPIAFLLGVLIGGYAQTVEAEVLSAWLSLAGSARTVVGAALARSLGDDSLRVAYWAENRQVFVDEAGLDVDVRTQSTPRQWQEVHVESRLVGAISYDERMIADPETVRRAGRVLAIALDRERLTAALLASNEALQQSRLRIVETADRERNRIARDLHDGLQVQLVLLALEAQQIANSGDAHPSTVTEATALRHRIDTAAADLRRLVHAVLPSALVERGLTAAAEDLVDRLEIPASLVSDADDSTLAPATSQSAYLIMAEALTNAVKHSDARTVNVRIAQRGALLSVTVKDDGRGGARVEDGTGLKGLVDRIDTLGGSFELVSPLGSGTEVRVELPCGS